MPPLRVPIFSTSLLFAALLLTPTTTAQTLIDPTVLPACALPCTLLNQAQSACVPPAAPAADQAAYTACFCQSSFLAPLYSSPNGVCDAFCPNPADLGRLQQWYVGLCRAGAAPGATTLSTSVVVVQETGTGGGAGAGTASATAGAAGTSGSGAASSSGGGGGWFSTHWRWVLMLIIIFLAMIFFTVLGLWLKRRHRRKRDANAGNVAAADAFRVPTPHPVVAAAPEMSGVNRSVGPQFGTARSAPAPVGGTGPAGYGNGNGKGRQMGGEEVGAAGGMKQKLNKRK